MESLLRHQNLVDPATLAADDSTGIFSLAYTCAAPWKWSSCSSEFVRPREDLLLLRDELMTQPVLGTRVAAGTLFPERRMIDDDGLPGPKRMSDQEAYSPLLSFDLDLSAAPACINKKSGAALPIPPLTVPYTREQAHIFYAAAARVHVADASEPDPHQQQPTKTKPCAARFREHVLDDAQRAALPLFLQQEHLFRNFPEMEKRVRERLLVANTAHEDQREKYRMIPVPQRIVCFGEGDYKKMYTRPVDYARGVYRDEDTQSRGGAGLRHFANLLVHLPQRQDVLDGRRFAGTPTDVLAARRYVDAFSDAAASDEGDDADDGDGDAFGGLFGGNAAPAAVSSSASPPKRTHVDKIKLSKHDFGSRATDLTLRCDGLLRFYPDRRIARRVASAGLCSPSFVFERQLLNGGSGDAFAEGVAQVALSAISKTEVVDGTEPSRLGGVLPPYANALATTLPSSWQHHFSMPTRLAATFDETPPTAENAREHLPLHYCAWQKDVVYEMTSVKVGFLFAIEYALFVDDDLVEESGGAASAASSLQSSTPVFYSSPRGSLLCEHERKTAAALRSIAERIRGARLKIMARDQTVTDTLTQSYALGFLLRGTDYAPDVDALLQMDEVDAVASLLRPTPVGRLHGADAVVFRALNALGLEIRVAPALVVRSCNRGVFVFTSEEQGLHAFDLAASARSARDFVQILRNGTELEVNNINTVSSLCAPGKDPENTEEASASAAQQQQQPRRQLHIYRNVFTWTELGFGVLIGGGIQTQVTNRAVPWRVYNGNHRFFYQTAMVANVDSPSRWSRRRWLFLALELGDPEANKFVQMVHKINTLYPVFRNVAYFL